MIELREILKKKFLPDQEQEPEQGEGKKKEQENQQKPKKKRRLSYQTKDKLIRMFLICYIGGNLFFFTSKLFFPYEPDLRFSEIGKTISYEDRNITLTRWEYAKAQKRMEVEFTIEDYAVDGNKTMQFQAVTRNEELPVTPVINEEDFIVLWIENVPEKKNTEIKLNMAIEGSKSGNFISFYTNTRDTNKKKSFVKKTKNEYLIENAKMVISDCEEMILNHRKKIEKNNTDMIAMQEEIVKLEAKKEFQIESEAAITDEKILYYQDGISNCKLNTEQREEKIKEYQEKLEKQKEYIKALEEDKI